MFYPDILFPRLLCGFMDFVFFRCCNDDSESQFLGQTPDENTNISEPPFEINSLVYKIIIGISEIHLLTKSSISSLPCPLDCQCGSDDIQCLLS